MKRYFKFDELNTNYKKEFIAGLTTFLSMAYILFVNPDILSLAVITDLPDDLRMPKEAIFTATAIAAAVGSLLMGVLARYPIALAPGMGLNAFFAFTVVLGMGISWQTALSGVLVSGLFFIVLTLTGAREKIINAIPAELKFAVAAGIGLFIAFIGFQNAGIIVNDDATLVSLGDLTNGATLLAVFGVLITVVLMVKGVNGGIFIGMVITAIVGMIFGLIGVPTAIVGSIPSLEPTFGVAFTHLGEIFTIQMLVVILTFLFVDFFDTAGTLVAVANQAGLMKNNKLPRAGRALFADSAATVVGATLGTSTTTSYIESSAGVAAGGRSGFTSVVTAGFFLLALFFSPLLGVITPAVTALALIIVGILMVSALGEIQWKQFEIAVPAFLTIVAMPLTYSIATGIAIGFIFYPITMIMKGRTKEIHPIMYGMFVIFVLYFVFLVE
ncbi:AGZA family xanthine/uracil permease-like MFS transporter [Bacillus mesophilus]|uniref:NCS2 family permease n=1 Tax=Bacillus mesophilus TaxID=1808955 RepID=A0A6M0QF89_9BACI|nr:NCS2 family permease [Bacillus mesophilus]MBM7663263.1 AGZA family xanthine/uracil permease-like MFS transporter [Bacillus mesophilus]NEY74048.1 NCS2 family permease [Bacillus mesophilus]